MCFVDGFCAALEPVRKLFERFHRFAGERRRGTGRWASLVHRSSPVTLPEPAASRPEGTLATAPASLAATRDALHHVPAAASHLLIAKVMKFLE